MDMLAAYSISNIRKPKSDVTLTPIKLNNYLYSNIPHILHHPKVVRALTVDI